MVRRRLLTERDVALDQLLAVRPIPYDAYLQRGGYAGLARAVSLPAAGVLDAVKRSGLLGRGGAGFSAGRKWEMVVQRPAKQKYVVCNAAEDEPGTFKDRYLLRHNPHQIIEGALIAAHAICAREVCLYINGHYQDEIAWMATAIREAEDHGHCDGPAGSAVKVQITPSPGTYVAGEETAVLEVIEGRVARPRQKPPYYPAAYGLYGMPTVVNNAETLANLPGILREGARWFGSVGNAVGTMIFTLTGEVERPGLYELPLGTPVRHLIETCGGGVRGGKQIKAFFPGGPSNSILLGDQMDTPLDFHTLRAAGSGLGTGAVIVMSEDTCMVRAAIEYGRFFARESCGQCPPCVLGLKHVSELMEKIESGEGDEKDVQQVGQVCTMVKGRGYCYLLTGAAIAVESIYRNFQHEFHAHVQHAGCARAAIAA